MSKFGIKISGCLGDIINITPVIKYLSRCHNQKLYLETNLPHLFKNNPYLEKIYDINIGEFIPDDVLAEDYRHPIPMGIPGIDNLLKGGLAKGEIGVILAPTGVGKSTLTTMRM